MNKNDKRKILEILGYKPDKKNKNDNEKTASLTGFGKAVKGAAIGATIGGSMGLNKAYEAVSQNPNMDSEEKAYHTIAPTVGKAAAGAAIGGIALPFAKSKITKAGKSVAKLFKTSEFLDELTYIKLASMNIPSNEEIEESKNISNDDEDDIVESNGLFSSSNKTLDSDYTLQNAKEKKTDISDIGLGR